MHACMRAYVHACMRACVHACMRACVHACMHVVVVASWGHEGDGIAAAVPQERTAQSLFTAGGLRVWTLNGARSSTWLVGRPMMVHGYPASSGFGPYALVTGDRPQACTLVLSSVISSACLSWSCAGGSPRPTASLPTVRPCLTCLRAESEVRH